MRLPVRANPPDLLLPLVLMVGGLFAAAKLGTGARAAAPGGPGAVATSGGRDEWATPDPPAQGPDAPALWLALRDAGGQRVYARAARLFRADASVIPSGEVVFLGPEKVAPILGAALGQLGIDPASWASFVSSYVARVGMAWNGDGTFTDQVWGLTIGMDQLYEGVNQHPGVDR